MATKIYVVGCSDEGFKQVHSPVAVCESPEDAVATATEYKSVCADVLIQEFIKKGNVFEPVERFYSPEGKRMKNRYDTSFLNNNDTKTDDELNEVFKIAGVKKD